MKYIVYASEDDGTLYGEGMVDKDPVTGQAEGYTRYELEGEFTLCLHQVLGSYGSIVEILFKAGVLKKT